MLFIGWFLVVCLPCFLIYLKTTFPVVVPTHSALGPKMPYPLAYRQYDKDIFSFDVPYSQIILP